MIRGVRGLDESDLKSNVEGYLLEKLQLTVKVEDAWMSGKLYVAKLEKNEDKTKDMENKSKLKDTRIFIDHDLSYGER